MATPGKGGTQASAPVTGFTLVRAAPMPKPSPSLLPIPMNPALLTAMDG